MGAAPERREGMPVVSDLKEAKRLSKAGKAFVWLSAAGLIVFLGTLPLKS